MNVEILKDGEWALGGTNVVELEEGRVHDFGAKENDLLVSAGWAKFVPGNASEVEEVVFVDKENQGLNWNEIFDCLDKDDGHFTKAGLPKTSAVRELAGVELTSKEIREAWDDFKG